MAAPVVEPQSLARVLEFQRRSVELCAEQFEAIEKGWAVRTPSLPAVWALNHVRVAGDVTPEQATELCQTYLEGLPFHDLFVEPELTGRRLADALRPAGWKVEVELHSVLAREPGHDTDTSVVIEPGEEEALDLMGRWYAEDKTLDLTEDAQRQLLESQRRTWRARHARRLGVRDGHGRLAGITLVFSDGPVAQVENVYVTPESRGRGYARALVTMGARLARQEHEFTFIVADDNDWPKQLYGRLGFEPVGRTWRLHHPLPKRSSDQ